MPPPAMELTPLSTSAPTLRNENDVLSLRVDGLRGDTGGDVGDEGVRRTGDLDAEEEGDTAGGEYARAVMMLGLWPLSAGPLPLPGTE
jgi:hypothetical protein